MPTSISNRETSLKLPIPSYISSLPESKKDGEPRNQVPEESFKSEEGWQNIFNFPLISSI